MTGVGIEPTTYGLKGGLETPPNAGNYRPFLAFTPEVPGSIRVQIRVQANEGAAPKEPPYRVL